MGSPSDSLAAPESVMIKTGNLQLTSRSLRYQLFGCMCLLPHYPASALWASGLFTCPLSSPFPHSTETGQGGQSDQTVAGPGAEARGPHPHFPVENSAFPKPLGSPGSWRGRLLLSQLPVEGSVPGHSLSVLLRAGPRAQWFALVTPGTGTKYRKAPGKPASFPCSLPFFPLFPFWFPNHMPDPPHSQPLGPVAGREGYT